MRYLELAMPIIIAMSSLFGIIQMMSLREWLFVLFFLVIFGMAVTGVIAVYKESKTDSKNTNISRNKTWDDKTDFNSKTK